MPHASSPTLIIQPKGIAGSPTCISNIKSTTLSSTTLVKMIIPIRCFSCGKVS
jgi:hypothetical protein